MKRLPQLFALLKFHASRMGWLAALGVGLIVFAAVFYLSGVRSTEAALAGTQAQIEALRAGETLGREGRAVSAEQRLARFQEFLPPASDLPEMLASVHQAADTHGIALENAQYKESREKGSPVMRYQMTLPLRASYPQIRAWLAEVMNGAPNAVLEELSLKRESAGNEELNARARLSLYFGVR